MKFYIYLPCVSLFCLGRRGTTLKFVYMRQHGDVMEGEGCGRFCLTRNLITLLERYRVDSVIIILFFATALRKGFMVFMGCRLILSSLHNTKLLYLFSGLLPIKKKILPESV